MFFYFQHILVCLSRTWTHPLFRCKNKDVILVHKATRNNVPQFILVECYLTKYYSLSYNSKIISKSIRIVITIR